MQPIHLSLEILSLNADTFINIISYLQTKTYNNYIDVIVITRQSIVEFNEK